MTINKQPRMPIILYEETLPGEPANPIPYIDVAAEEEMPKVLFISEYKQTNEFEPGPKGPLPIVETLIHSFVSMEFLKKNLDPKTNDKVRMALGLKPLRVAAKEGRKVLDKIERNAQKRRTELTQNQETRTIRTFKLVEDLKNKSEKLKQQLDSMPNYTEEKKQ
jgi:hypothetical protein